MTATKDLQAAAAALRGPYLPAYLTVPVRVVQGDSENLDTLSWCETQHPDDEDCEACAVAETPHWAIASLIAALLAGRESFAAWLENVPATHQALLAAIDNGTHDEPQRGELAHALTAARAILGGAR